MHTPNIDALASSGTAFHHAFCQQAICAPARNSFLSGRRPQRTKSWNFIDSFREVGPDWITLPQYFKQHGYVALATGKTYHPGLPPNWDAPHSWSSDEPYFFAPNAYPKCAEWPHSLACPTDEPLEAFSDWLDMNRTRAQLHRYGAASANASLTSAAAARDGGGGRGRRPFFLVFGAHRPHLPWHVPRKFWDQYNPTEAIRLAAHEEAPVDMPPIAFTYECDGQTHMSAFNESAPVPYPAASTALPHNMSRSFRRGYYAAVSFTDALIGTLLDTLVELRLTDETVVALMGDHGWQLGEHNIWGKHTNFELGTRVPLIIRAPGTRYAAGRVVSNAVVESVDLYPTLAALAGLPPPPDVDGVDLSPLMVMAHADAPPLAQDEEENEALLRRAAYSEYPRCPRDLARPWEDSTSCTRTPRTNFTAMGYSVRTLEWRYTAWLHWDAGRLQGDFSRPAVAVELYAHAGDSGTDMDAFENVNVAADPAHRTTLEAMHALARRHWDGVTGRPPVVEGRAMQYE